MGLPVRRDEHGPPHLTMRPPALPPGMPFELVHVRTAGLDVYSTHLQPMPAQAAHRVQQVLFIDDAVGRSCDPSASMPPILCGDFNAEPMSDEIRFLTAKAVINGRSTYFQDAWAIVHDGGGITWDPANDLAAGANEPPPASTTCSSASRLAAPTAPAGCSTRRSCSTNPEPARSPATTTGSASTSPGPHDHRPRTIDRPDSCSTGAISAPTSTPVSRATVADTRQSRTRPSRVIRVV